MSATAEEMRAFFDGCAADWDAHSQADARKLCAIVTLAGVTAGTRVLDIACGTGVLEGELLSRAPQAVTAVDLSPAMLQRAREKYRDARVRFVAGDVLALAEDAPFDAAIVYNAYPHFADKAAFARKAAALLRVGGRLTIAHGASRADINACHGSAAARRVSVGLRSAQDEAEALSPYFSVDICADTPEIYIISGIKREETCAPCTEFF